MVCLCPATGEWPLALFVQVRGQKLSAHGLRLDVNIGYSPFLPSIAKQTPGTLSVFIMRQPLLRFLLPDLFETLHEFCHCSCRALLRILVSHIPANEDAWCVHLPHIITFLHLYYQPSSLKNNNANRDCYGKCYTDYLQCAACSVTW